MLKRNKIVIHENRTDEIKSRCIDSDGPIPIPNIQYRRYQGLEEKYRYWRGISIVSIRLSLRCFTFWSADSAWTTKRSKQRACYFERWITKFERWINGRVNSIPVCYQSWVICHTWHICRLMYCLLLQYYCCWWIKKLPFVVFASYVA